MEWGEKRREVRRGKVKEVESKERGSKPGIVRVSHQMFPCADLAGGTRGCLVVEVRQERTGQSQTLGCLSRVFQQGVVSDIGVFKGVFMVLGVS